MSEHVALPEAAVDPLPEDIVRDVGAYVRRVKNAIIKRDIIITEYPKIRSPSDDEGGMDGTLQQIDRMYNTLKDRIETAEIQGADISQSYSYHLLNVYHILHYRRVFEWHERPQYVQPIVKGGYITLFRRDVVQAFVNSMQACWRLSGGHFPQVGQRDQKALLESPEVYRMDRRYTRDYIERELMGNLMGLTPEERVNAGMPAQPRDAREVKADADVVVRGDQAERNSTSRVMASMHGYYHGRPAAARGPQMPPLLQPRPWVMRPRPPQLPLLQANGRNNSDPFLCAICQTERTPGAVDAVPHFRTPCDHRYCAECLGKWLQRADNCPTCRTPVPRQTLDPDLAARFQQALALHARGPH